MVTFVKLTNGDIVNTQHIKSIKRHEHMSARAVAVFLRENQDNKRVETQPSIELQLGSDPNPLLLKYESEQERDTEFERIEAILIPKPQVLFKDLLLVPETIQGLKVGWGNVMQTSLKLDIIAADGKSYQVFVNRDDEAEWSRVEKLIAHYGLSIPKTTLELLADKYDKEGNRESEDAF